MLAFSPQTSAASRDPEPQSKESCAAFDVLPARFLLVEPDQADARLLGAALVRAGFLLEMAGTVADARRKLRQKDFDLVLAADPLPDGSALELLGRVAEIPEVPLVLLLDDVSADAVREAFAAGVLDFFVKDGALLPLLPLRIERLLQLLSERRILMDLFAENARLAEVNSHMREIATRDPLTGALDERGFAEAVRCEAARAERTGQPIAIAFFDLDLFHHLNEARGRDAGDALLRSVCELLRRETRGGDAVARMDGDGFAALLPGATLAGALRFAERVREKVESNRVAFRDDTLGTTLSGAAGLLASPPESPDELVAYARERLRELKAGGRNRVGIFA